VHLGKIVRRFFVPPFWVTLHFAVGSRCMVSPRAEVELSPLLKIGKGTQVGSFTKIKASDGPMEIGTNVSIGTNCFLSSDTGGVMIGDDCMISPNVTIVGNNYRYDRLDIPISAQEKTSEGIRIGCDVWIGAGVAILDGSEIGDGVIIAPNSVVSKSIPARSIVQGDPARVIFTRR